MSEMSKPCLLKNHGFDTRVGTHFEDYWHLTRVFVDHCCTSGNHGSKVSRHFRNGSQSSQNCQNCQNCHRSMIKKRQFSWISVNFSEFQCFSGFRRPCVTECDRVWPSVWPNVWPSVSECVTRRCTTVTTLVTHPPITRVPPTTAPPCCTTLAGPYTTTAVHQAPFGFNTEVMHSVRGDPNPTHTEVLKTSKWELFRPQI